MPDGSKADTGLSTADEDRPRMSEAVGGVRSMSAGGGSATSLPGTIDQLSSFGEDGRGELYATSLAGTLYRLR